MQPGTVFSLNLKLQFRERERGGISQMVGLIVLPAGFCRIGAVGKLFCQNGVFKLEFRERMSAKNICSSPD